MKRILLTVIMIIAGSCSMGMAVQAEGGNAFTVDGNSYQIIQE